MISESKGSNPVKQGQKSQETLPLSELAWFTFCVVITSFSFADLSAHAFH